MSFKTHVRTVTLADLVRLFVKRLWAMALAAILTVLVIFLLYAVVIPPQYQSTATLYILKQRNDNSTAETSQDFSLALNVVNDCTYLLKSHAVVDQVISDLNLDTTYKSLSQSISTSNPDNTRILEVTVTSDSPEKAKQIVDEVCNVGASSIAQAMGFNQVNIYEYGTLNPRPSNHKGLTSYVVAGIAAALVVYAVSMIAYLFDDRIRNNDDITQYLGISVLGEIPDATEAHHHHYGYYGKYGYGKYGYGKK